jgi:hypothetical protein
VYYVLRAKHVTYRRSRWGAVLRGLFVLVVYAILFAVATLALIFAAILLR